jgi:hypothetical protein
MQLEYIAEPKLEFAFDQHEEYPRDGLFLFGPIKDSAAPETVRYGVIGTSDGIQRVSRWSRSVQGYIQRFAPRFNPTAQHHTSFPGFESVYRAKWPAEPLAKIEVSEKAIQDALKIGNRFEAVKRAVDLYVNPLVAFSKKEEAEPAFWFVVIPELVYQLGRPTSKVSKAERIQGVVMVSQARARLIKTAPTLFGEEEEEAEVYLYAKNFRRQLKARLLKDKIVTQIVRETTLAPEDFKTSFGSPMRRMEDPATIAWKLCTTAYYKAGGKPWRLSGVRPGVCYVGLVYKQTDPESEDPNACCAAQMFLSSGDGIVFRGAAGPWYTPSNKEYHLEQAPAAKLMSLVVSEYKRMHNNEEPKELFIHGRSRFNTEEWSGFQAAVPSTTNLVGVQIRDGKSELKLFTSGNFPVIRGTALKLTERSAYLWTTGYVPRLNTYMGPETPNPIFIHVQKGDCPLNTVLADVMRLTKLNYNSCLFNDRLPVTIKFANAVGEILISAPQTEEPKLPFKFYI